VGCSCIYLAVCHRVGKKDCIEDGRRSHLVMAVTVTVLVHRKRCRSFPSAFPSVRWRSWLSHLSNTQKVLSSSLGRIISLLIFVQRSSAYYPRCTESVCSFIFAIVVDLRQLDLFMLLLSGASFGVCLGDTALRRDIRAQPGWHSQSLARLLLVARLLHIVQPSRWVVVGSLSSR
jgi:hypothetical protein